MGSLDIKSKQMRSTIITEKNHESGFDGVRFANRILKEGIKTLVKPQCAAVHTLSKPQFNTLYGNLANLPNKVRSYVEENAKLCRPDNIHICDGSDKENDLLLYILQKDGMIKPLPKLDNWLTIIATEDEKETRPTVKEGVTAQLNNWMNIEDMESELNIRFPGCMSGRTMFVIPFSMGPLNSPLSKIGIQLTDSPYVVASMRIMTRMGSNVLDILGGSDFIKCLHSVGCPLPLKEPSLHSHWPCNPKKTLIAHLPERNEICSFGSGYGGNSLLGKKCFALRLGQFWHRGKDGDDIAWMKFDKDGRLRAINPEAGFFGVAPGTSMKTNPNAMETVMSNTVFTNVAETSDGGVFWEGMEGEVDLDDVKVKSWLGIQDWTKSSGTSAAHPNSRFCTPASQCPIMDPLWESPEGVPIEAIIFGGRRPEGVPLVYEAFSWQHGVFIGGAMRSEATAAAEHKAKVIMHDPFAMRPFFGYNFGHYLKHWLSFQDNADYNLPKIFHVNWFRKNGTGSFMWPGFGENSRVLDWIFRRVDGEDCAQRSAIGYVPKPGSIDLSGLKEKVDMEGLFSLSQEFWQQECRDIENTLKSKSMKTCHQKSCKNSVA
ncbi:hypothetical protein ScPMuIL_001560 [Solemya velum]